MIRLLQVMAGARHGGAETFFVRLVAALHRRGVPQRVIIRRDPERAAAIRAIGPEPLGLAFGGALDFLTRRRVAAAIGRFEPDVALTWMNRGTARTPPGRHVKVARLGGYYSLRYYQDCDHLIGNTAAIRNYILAKGWPRERAHHLPNFVPEPVAPPLPRAEFDTPDDAPLLLALGRLHANKAFDVLLHALARLPNAHLWIAGEGPERAALTNLAGALGVDTRVRFLGWREDTEALRATADILVCPSRHEPLGNVVLEAWAAGLPVVAAAADGPRALIRDGETGLLAPPEDADALAARLSTLISDGSLRGALAEAGRSAWAENHTEAKVTDGYLDLLTRLKR